MKLTFATEDCVVGIAVGFLLIMYAGKIYPLKLPNYLYAIAFGIFIIFIILDIIHEVSDLSIHPGFILLSILHSVADMVLSIGLISYFTGLNIPYVTSLIVPYLQNEAMILYAGIFLIAGNLIWLVMYPFIY